VIAVIPGRGQAVIQIKTVGSVTFRKKWIDEDGETEPPLWIMLQATLERHLTGSDLAMVAPLVVDEYFDARLPLIDVPDVPGLVDQMKARAVRFWSDVDAGIEPPADYGRDAGIIDRVYPQADPDHEIDLTQNDDVARLLGDRREAQRARRMATRQIESIDAEIKHIMADASVAHIGEGRKIHWRNERRPGRWTAPTNGRVLRLPKSTED